MDDYEPFEISSAQQEAADFIPEPLSASDAEPIQASAPFPAEEPVRLAGEPVFVSTPPVQPKKKHHGLKLAAAALALVIAGGAAGWGASRLIDSRSSEPASLPTLQAPGPGGTENDPAEVQAKADAAPEAAEAAPAVKTPVHNVVPLLQGDDTQTLTPAEIYAQCVGSVVAIANTGTTTNVFGQASATASSGSGFIVSQDGYIITNYHVVEDADSLEVTLTSGESYPAEIIGTEADGDVALIKIDATGLTPVTLGDSDALVVGEQVIAIGNPLGELTNTLTVGYISALDREIGVESGKDLNVFQTDCAINPGNSGGPLFDLHGNVIGITTAKYSSSSVEGIGFVLPINDVSAIVGDLMEFGYVTGKPYLGVQLKNLSADVTAYYGLSGIYVAVVEEGGAAAEAGMQVGDIITALNDETVNTSTELTAALKAYRAGDVVTISILRSGQSMTLTVTLGDKHDAEVAAAAKAAAEAEQQQEQQQQQPSGGYYGYPGMDDFFNYFFGQR